MDWFANGEYTALKTLWDGAQRLQLVVPHGGTEQFVLEERDWPTEAQAQAAAEADREWIQWLSFCHHPGLLLPLAARTSERRSQVVYPCKGAEICWPDYVGVVFQEYMAGEELCLELAYRLTLSWGALLGKGLRPVSLEKPAPHSVLLTGEGDVRALPPRFCPGGPVGAAPILEGIGELLFSALTRQPAGEHAPVLSQCRKLNLEITKDAEAMVRRCFPGQADSFEMLAALTRALTKLHIRREPSQPYRDAGPLVAFRANVADRDYNPEIEAAVSEVPTSRLISQGPDQWRGRFYDDVRRWVVLLPCVNLLLLVPLAFMRLQPGAVLVHMLGISALFWMLAISIYAGYRRRNV